MKDIWEHNALCNELKMLTEKFHCFDAHHQTAQESCINRVLPTHPRIEISEVLNTEEKNEYTEGITEDGIEERVIVSNSFSEVANDDDEVSFTPSFDQQLAAAALVERICETYNMHYIS